MSASNGTPLTGQGAEDLVRRCRLLCTELDQFRDYLKTQYGQNGVRIGYFRNNVISELKHIEKVIQTARDSGNSVDHNVASSNIPSYEAIWNTVKNTTGLVALQKYFYFGKLLENQGQKTRLRHGDHVYVREGKALVNVVAGYGREWIKVSLVTNHRILMDKAKEGWGQDGFGEAGETDEESDAEADQGIPIVRMTEELVEAAKEVKVKGGHPRVRLVLPRVVERQNSHVDSIVRRLRALGVTVDCSDLAPHSVALGDVINDILPDNFAGLTDTLNVDCTILLALVSDLSHCAVKAKSWYHRGLDKQVEAEEQESLLSCKIYPAIRGRQLVCTREAATRMQEIVKTIGTESEQARARLLMGDSDDVRQASLRSSLQHWSKIEVPKNLQLPVKLVDKDEGDRELPIAAAAFKANAIPMNQSVFMYGWRNGLTTVTSNHTVVKKLEGILQQHDASEEDWPKIWLCTTARSLVGKDNRPRVSRDMMNGQTAKDDLV